MGQDTMVKANKEVRLVDKTWHVQTGVYAYVCCVTVKLTCILLSQALFNIYVMHMQQQKIESVTL